MLLVYLDNSLNIQALLVCPAMSGPANSVVRHCPVLQFQSTQCVSAIEQWMAASRLRLNMDKTELIWTGTKNNLSKIPGSGRALTLGGAHVAQSDNVRVVGSVTRQARQRC